MGLHENLFFRRKRPFTIVFDGLWKKIWTKEKFGVNMNLYVETWIWGFKKIRNHRGPVIALSKKTETHTKRQRKMPRWCQP